MSRGLWPGRHPSRRSIERGCKLPARIGDQQALQLPAGQSLLNGPAQQQQAAPQGGRVASLYLNYDADVASLQWDKLEKAQQVAVAKVSPLHVNLLRLL